MNTIENKILCRKCKNEANPDEDDIVMCENCFIMTSADQCKIDNEISCIVQDECKTKYSVTIQQDMLKNAVDIPIKQERSFSKALFKKTFDAEINLKENIITKLGQSNDGN